MARVISELRLDFPGDLLGSLAASRHPGMLLIREYVHECDPLQAHVRGVFMNESTLVFGTVVGNVHACVHDRIHDHSCERACV